jgi:hypothetical protein
MRGEVGYAASNAALASSPQPWPTNFLSRTAQHRYPSHGNTCYLVDTAYTSEATEESHGRASRAAGTANPTTRPARLRRLPPGFGPGVEYRSRLPALVAAS